MNVDDLNAVLSNEGYLIDVREPEEYAGGHVPGARLVPLATVPAAVAELPRDQPVYVICEVGARSARAAMFLAHQGVDAHNVAGGTQAWAAAGLPLEY